MNPYLQLASELLDKREGIAIPPYRVARGRRIYLGHALATLAFAAGLFVENILFFTPTQPLRQVFNLAVIAACTFLANRGSTAAKWAIMLLLGFGGVRVIRFVWGNYQDMSWFDTATFAAAGCVYYSFAMVLG